MFGFGLGLRRGIGAALSGGSDYASIVTNGVLASYVTFTRASSGTYYDSAGVLQTASTNVPRITYDPATLVLRGLLIEEARTNLCLHSRDLTNAAWAKTNVTAAKDQTGIDAAANSASKITATAGNGTCLQSVVSASAARSTTAYVKRITGSGVIEMTQDGGTTWAPVTVTASWTRVGPATATVTNPQIGFRIVTSGDAIAVDAVQLEAGAFATSYIQTTSAAVTRAADSGICSDLSLLGYDQTKGTIYIEGVGPAGQMSEWVQLNNATINEGVFLYSSSGTAGISGYRDGGVTQASVACAITVETPWKFATAFAANDFASCANGGAVSTDASGTLGTPTRLVLGAACGSFSGIVKVVSIKNLRYYWRKFSPDELQALTA